MRKITLALAAIVAATVLTSSAFCRPQDSTKDKSKDDSMKDCPMHEQHVAASQSAADAHAHPAGAHASLESRGNRAMGFEQGKTTHHFLLKPQGGAIQVQANDPKDTASVEQVRKHFQRIAAAFAAGDFQIPMLVHAAIPPGATAMKRLHEKIQYVYEQTPAGARVLIKTEDPSALDAIHDFLRYQIREHQTADPETAS